MENFQQKLWNKILESIAAGNKMKNVKVIKKSRNNINGFWQNGFRFDKCQNRLNKIFNDCFYEFSLNVSIIGFDLFLY